MMLWTPLVKRGVVSQNEIMLHLLHVCLSVCWYMYLQELAESATHHPSCWSEKGVVASGERTFGQDQVATGAPLGWYLHKFLVFSVSTCEFQ